MGGTREGPGLIPSSPDHHCIAQTGIVARHRQPLSAFIPSRRLVVTACRVNDGIEVIKREPVCKWWGLRLSGEYSTHFLRLQPL
jgi:hypothetical protein